MLAVGEFDGQICPTQHWILCEMIACAWLLYIVRSFHPLEFKQKFYSKFTLSVQTGVQVDYAFQVR